MAKYYFSSLLILSSGMLEAKLQAQVAEVLRVEDGDSITVKIDQTKYRIRLAEIDAPELDQAWGAESKAALLKKLQDEEVALEVIDVDRYSRLVARVFLNGRHINREMIREGHAWVYLEYLRDDSLISPEAEARGKKLGLWASDEVIAPWQWRRTRP
ncbi:thermonuclease family protein [Gammaproteobacteria bacterium]|nr:thermonuclease family protein [Gammaproteobacteria bacterium]